MTSSTGPVQFASLWPPGADIRQLTDVSRCNLHQHLWRNWHLNRSALADPMEAAVQNAHAGKAVYCTFASPLDLKEAP